MLRTYVYHFVSFCEDVIAHHSLACRVEANNDHAQQKQHYQKLARLHISRHINKRWRLGNDRA